MRREEEAGRCREGFWGGFKVSVEKEPRPMSRPDALDAALSLPDRINPDGRTQNSSLHYKRLEHPAHRVSRVRWSTR